MNAKRMRRHMLRMIARHDQLLAQMRLEAPDICEIVHLGARRFGRTAKQRMIAWECCVLIGAQQQIASMQRILSEVT